VNPPQENDVILGDLIREAARNAYETSQRRPAGERLAGIELICDDLAAWAYALGYNAARDDTLTRDLARSPRWDDQPSSTKGDE
jgi:hypothetical protein